MEKFIIDRIDHSIAFCEDDNGEIIKINISIIEGKVKEGVVIIRTEDGFKVDNEATKSREKYINDLMEGMWEDE
ncbi:DUF3006 domain-containing protein [Clostridium sp.]|uniref:DUF3006 domain-containing protein n=1 Tax=Clostridium sp. TaxID=1506 RepID=UPI003463FE3F